MFLNGESGPEDVELRAYSHLEVHLIYLILDGVSSDVGCSTCWREDASYHGEKCGLARTIRPEQPEDDLILNNKVQIIDC